MSHPAVVVALSSLSSTERHPSLTPALSGLTPATPSNITTLDPYSRSNDTIIVNYLPCNLLFTILYVILKLTWVELSCKFILLYFHFFYSIYHFIFLKKYINNQKRVIKNCVVHKKIQKNTPEVNL